MSSSNVVREAQSVETYEATAKQKAAAKLSWERTIAFFKQHGEALPPETYVT